MNITFESLLDMAKRAVVPVVAAVLLVIAIFQGWVVFGLLMAAVVLLGIYDTFQSRWTITRNYPVAGRIRWLFYDLRPYLHSYIVEGDLDGKPFSLAARNLVHARADGATDTQPFGTERDTDADSYHWIGHSISPTQNPDKSPRVEVGSDQCSKPYSASVLNISAMSFGALSANAVRALNLGAKKGGYYHDTGEGGLSPYHLENGGDIVWELGSGYFGARDKDGSFDPEKFAETAQRDEVKMTEIKLSQGAKPGHGGLLPAAKVTDEIAKIRQVPAHEDCLSPRGHSAFSTPIEMLEFAAKMRDLSGGKPVGLKLCIGQPHEPFAIMKGIIETGIHPDFIVVDGGEGGTGAAPLELSDWVGMPLSEGLVLMRNALVGAGVKSQIRLAASGKVYSGMGLARNIAQGADWCNAARAFMFSVGCIQAQRCHLGTCPTGVTAQEPARQRGLIPEVQGERSARFHEKTVDALMEIVASAGLDHPGQLEPHHLMQSRGPERALPMDRIATFLAEGALREAPDDTIYADFWRAARADSFRPAIDLARVRAS
ncbi:glutamate synthase domain-containing protein 2 [Sagittula marina]|uniref:Glutamate synthase domain-containing protein 2 n=1 Tax=Sagittula marina TaxID=943940 RepID=A0A7W6GRZ2_9RHOB|nr:FMN-binding glutamate synthase family protein [Sagittula marina]MBB3985415.1 glutamate synthase domain-containing protein 2 [Sagittula marina]